MVFCVRDIIAKHSGVVCMHFVRDEKIIIEF